MNRAECVDWVYEAANMESLGIEFVDYDDLMTDWHVSQMLVDGLFVGVLMRKENEIHMQLEKSMALVYARKIIRKHLEPLLQEFGHLTSIALTGSTDIQFLERLGFYETNSTEQVIMFRLDQLKIR